MMRKLAGIVLGLMLGQMAIAENSFKVAALNVDGMPRKINIVADINLNPDGKEAAGATAIGKKLRQMEYDFVAVSEDFNYNNEIMAEIGDLYSQGTHRGIIEVTAAALGNFLGQKTVFDTDGLNLFCRKATTSFSNESWTGWTMRNGYTSDGADGMIAKGFRYYTITIHDSVEVDVYIVHMDAECTDKDEAARASNISQVAAAILASNNGRPIIILGDTNCRYNRDELKRLLIDALNADARFTAQDVWVEHMYDGVYPEFVSLGDASQSLLVGELGYQKGEVVDKIIYVNNNRSPYLLRSQYYLQDTTFVNEQGEPLADHWPVVTTFTYHKRQLLTDTTNVKNPADVAWVGEDPRKGGKYYIYHPYTQKFLSYQGTSLSVADAPTFLWQMEAVSQNGDIATMTMNNGAYWFNLTKDGFGAKPQLTNTYNSTEVSPSGTNTAMNAYKIHRTANPARYLNYNGKDFTGAQNKGEQNDWVFISEAQYNDSISTIVYGDPIPTGIHDSGSDPVVASKFMRNGRLYIRRGEMIFDLNGRKTK